LKYPTNNKLVIKIAKGQNKDKLDIEFQSHKSFYDTLKQWKSDYPWQLSDNIVIPKVWRIFWKDWCFTIKKIEWQSIKTRFYIEYYKKEFKELWLDESYLKQLNDWEIKQIMRKNNLQYIIEPLNFEVYDYKNFDLTSKLIDYFSNFKKTDLWIELEKTTTLLKEYWLEHTDLHPWNIMFWNNWKIYIIDFWRVGIKNNFN
jgi:hypothetical protein